MTAKQKGFGYFLGIVVGLVTLLSLFASTVVRLHAVEMRVTRVPGIEWDLRINKAMWAKLYPSIYDSVLDQEIKQNGQRPEGKNE